MARLLGATAAVALILGVALAVIFLCRRQQKSRLETDRDGMDPSPSQKLEPPPNRQSHLASEDIQILPLDPGKQQLQQEVKELQKPPQQTPYYDLGTPPFYRPLGSGLKDSDVHYAELDMAALELVPGPRTAALGPREAVDYATVQLSPP